MPFSYHRFECFSICLLNLFLSKTCCKNKSAGFKNIFFRFLLLGCKWGSLMMPIGCNFTIWGINPNVARLGWTRSGRRGRVVSLWWQHETLFDECQHTVRAFTARRNPRSPRPRAACPARDRKEVRGQEARRKCVSAYACSQHAHKRRHTTPHHTTPHHPTPHQHAHPPGRPWRSPRSP